MMAVHLRATANPALTFFSVETFSPYHAIAPPCFLSMKLMYVSANSSAVIALLGGLHRFSPLTKTSLTMQSTSVTSWFGSSTVCSTTTATALFPALHASFTNLSRASFCPYGTSLSYTLTSKTNHALSRQSIRASKSVGHMRSPNSMPSKLISCFALDLLFIGTNAIYIAACGVAHSRCN